MKRILVIGVVGLLVSLMVACASSEEAELGVEQEVRETTTSAEDVYGEQYNRGLTTNSS